MSLSSGTANATVGGTTTQLQYSNAGTLAGANLYYIGGTGSLGVSRSTPVANLDVLGTISASDAIQVSGSSLTCSSARGFEGPSPWCKGMCEPKYRDCLRRCVASRRPA